MATRVIRYFENNEWKYASVKDVGDLSNLKTTRKQDLVTAINDLIDNGLATAIPSELSERIQFLEDRVAKQQEQLNNQGSKIDSNTNAVKDSASQVEELKGNYEITQQYLDTIKEAQDKITNKAKELEDKTNEVVQELINKADKDDLLSKVDVDKHEQDYEEVVSQLKDKIDSTNFNDLKGKVGVVEKEIVDLNEEVSTKITSIDFDDAVGVNKWIVSKYPVEGTDFNQTPPSFSLISGVGASEIVDINDSVNMIAFSEGENFISHYFTNVKMKSQKTISMNVEYDDSLSIYLNGASIYSYKYNDAQQVKVSISLRAGWNTIEMLHGQATGNPVLTVDTPLSTQVDKMTTVIGVGDKDETRLIKNETAILQTEKEITLKADKTVVENIGNKVIDNEASIQVLSDGIQSKVEKKEFDNYTKRLNNAESLIEQTAESITSKVDKTEYDTLNETVVAQGTEITQLKDEIVLKVEKEDFNELSGRVNEAETSITLNQDAIALKAEKTELDNVSGKVNNIESELVITNEAINQRVTKTEFEKLENETGNLGTRISNAESTLEQTEKEIALRVTRQEFEEETSTAIKESEAQIKITTDGILQSVSDLNSTVSEHGTSITENSSSIETLNNQIKSKVTQTEIDDSIKRINLGGENLFQNSNLAYFDENGIPDKWDVFDSSFEVDGSTLLDGNNTIHFKYASGTYPIASSNYIDVTSHIGEEVVFSVYALIPLDKELSNVPYIEIASYSDNSISNQGGANPQFASLRLPTKGNGKWVRYECKGKIPEKNAFGNVVKIKANLRFNGSTNPSFNDEFWYGLPQLEYGSIKQDWRPSSIDLTSDITELSVRIKEAEQVITPDAIIGTVTSSESFANLMDEKADASVLGEYTTNDQLSDALDDVNSNVDKKISEIDFTPFVQSSTFKQTTNDITAKFTSAGGVNLIKNSVGFAGLDFWTGSNLSGIGTISDDGELEALGYGSGFLFTPSTTANSLVQVVNVIPNQEYTLSWSINKNNSSPSGAMDGAFAVQFMDETATTSLKTYWYQSPDITDGFQNYRTDYSDDIDAPLKHVITYKPTTNKIAIRFYAYKLADVAITGILLNVGSQPLQWSMAQGEIYNTSMKMDMKGLKVSKIDDNKVSRFTVMTPEKFAGYYDVNKDGVIDDSTGSPDEIFRMAEDYFVMKNAIISGEEAELEMNPITMKKIKSGGNNGLAFVPSVE